MSAVIAACSGNDSRQRADRTQPTTLQMTATRTPVPASCIQQSGKTRKAENQTEGTIWNLPSAQQQRSQIGQSSTSAELVPGELSWALSNLLQVTSSSCCALFSSAFWLQPYMPGLQKCPDAQLIRSLSATLLLWPLGHSYVFFFFNSRAEKPPVLAR